MNRHLVLLSDSDETDMSDHEKDQGQEQAADEAIVDRTCMFMSNLEQDFDRQMAMGEGIPSLPGDTVLKNMYGPSFVDFAGQKDEYDCAAPMGPNALHTQLQKPAFLSPRLQSSHEITHKGSILNGPLSSHPSLPQSLEAQRPSAPIRSPSRATSNPSRLSTGRNVPLPAPIVTSHEGCEMISKRHSRRNSAHSAGPLMNISAESSRSSSSSSAPRTPWSEYSTPLTSCDPLFDIQSRQVVAMGTNDPRTGIKALEQENSSTLWDRREQCFMVTTVVHIFSSNLRFDRIILELVMRLVFWSFVNFLW
ncbi:hypothetical protein BG011_005640 [Mortierella polycephala]|uniref:Uncharacterized protein n=1 Tax=Mortierella polycephala TaxID=41804 RepID=A0A9P6U0M4_9FUNG|nr:hypothetical protein BG011_005640 [Mortierella polycephala]